MESLKRVIIEKANVYSEDVLDLDCILNQYLDPILIMEIGKEFANRFSHRLIDKVLTIESSGISVGLATAYALGVPLVFARRKKTLMVGKSMYHERVPSFTKGMMTDLFVSSEFLFKEEKILLIDDIIANGDTAKGLIRIIEKAQAHLVGVGIVVEKTFQYGAQSIREKNIHVESLVQVSSLSQGKIEWK